MATGSKGKIGVFFDTKQREVLFLAMFPKTQETALKSAINETLQMKIRCTITGVEKQTIRASRCEVVPNTRTRRLAGAAENPWRRAGK